MAADDKKKQNDPAPDQEAAPEQAPAPEQVAAPEQAAASLVRVRSKVRNSFYNPYTKQTITPFEELEVVLDGWLQSQIDADYVEILK